MGPQLLTSKPGFASSTTQTGPSPLQVLLEKPISFVPETVNAATFETNEPAYGEKRRPAIMSLDEYKAMRSGKSYIKRYRESPEQQKDGGLKKRLSTPQPASKEDIETSSSEASSPEPALATVPQVARPEKPAPVKEPVESGKENETNVDNQANGTTKSRKSGINVSPEVSRKRQHTPPTTEEQSPSKKLKNSAEASVPVKATNPKVGGTGSDFMNRREEFLNKLKGISSGTKVTKPVNGVASKESQTNKAPALNKGPIETKAVNEAADAFPKEFPAEMHDYFAKGITNRGFWCYRNSIIQALLHIPAIYDYLSKHDRPNGDKCPRPGAGCICCLLREFTSAHFSSEEGVINKKPKALELIDKLLGGEFAKTGYRHEQQDADEYVICMLDKAVEQQKCGREKEKTVLEKLLEVTTAQVVICSNKSCKHRSQTKSSNTSLRAKMTGQNQAAVHLNDLISDLEASENIKDYKCEKCRKLGATIKRQFTELPPALMVHVNRGGKANYRGQAVKLNNWLQFDNEIQLCTSNGVSHKYLLRSVVSHHGNALNSGHYVCFGRNPNRKSWSMFNDSRVQKTPSVKFRGGKDGKPEFSAYILMYGRA